MNPVKRYKQLWLLLRCILSVLLAGANYPMKHRNNTTGQPELVAVISPGIAPKCVKRQGLSSKSAGRALRSSRKVMISPP